MSRIDWEKQQVRDKKTQERQAPPRSLGPRRRILSTTPQHTGFSFGRSRVVLLLELECGHRVLSAHLPREASMACGKCQYEGKP